MRDSVWSDREARAAMTNATAQIAETRFFTKTYDETVALLEQTRDYLTHALPPVQAQFAPVKRTRINCESMRVTARLAQVMAWLLAQRAAFHGEITREEAAGERFCMSEQKVCMAETAPDDLPERLYELLELSRRLYIRVMRLDELNRRSLQSA
jgi:regulator of CtrA degradation